MATDTETAKPGPTDTDRIEALEKWLAEKCAEGHWTVPFYFDAGAYSTVREQIDRQFKLNGGS